MWTETSPTTPSSTTTRLKSIVIRLAGQVHIRTGIHYCKITIGVTFLGSWEVETSIRADVASLRVREMEKDKERLELDLNRTGA